MTVSMPNMFPSGSLLGGSRRDGSESRRGRRQQNVTLADSSTSTIAQSFSDFVIGESSESSQGFYPPSHINILILVHIINMMVLKLHNITNLQ